MAFCSAYATSHPSRKQALQTFAMTSSTASTQAPIPLWDFFGDAFFDGQFSSVVEEDEDNDFVVVLVPEYGAAF